MEHVLSLEMRYVAPDEGVAIMCSCGQEWWVPEIWRGEEELVEAMAHVQAAT